MGKWMDSFLASAKVPEARKPEPATFTVSPGLTVPLHPMRPSCQGAGHCLALTVEADCDRYPVRPGLCRERIPLHKETKIYSIKKRRRPTC